ncbi:MAG TPA: DUF1573 domain-containing protein [Cytophagaceae bacterium]|jgi:hypothetical protein|nr:DUF1573 domain-containing protein [Cytophagaceae bacterium]
MIRKINYTLLLLIAVVALNACDSKEKSASSKDSSFTVVPEVPEKPVMPITKLEFLETSFDFGKIEEGKKVEHVFKFKNTGENPLVLKDARASCGCTIPEYTKDTIAPGSEGELKVIYDSSNKGGQIEKTVTVTANTDPATTDIKISAFVEKKVAGPYNNK